MRERGATECQRRGGIDTPWRCERNTCCYKSGCEVHAQHLHQVATMLGGEYMERGVEACR
jgi:hypothetical protein